VPSGGIEDCWLNTGTNTSGTEKKKVLIFFRELERQNFKYPFKIKFSIQGKQISVFDTKMHSIIFRICGKQFIFFKRIKV